MKHKLKLLLTISTLILPSAFAATHHEHTAADGANTRVVTVAADTQALTHKSSFRKLPPDMISMIIGSVGATSLSGANMSIDDIIRSICNGERFDGAVFLGYLTVADLAALSRVSRAFGAMLGSILSAAKRVVVARIVPLEKQLEPTEAERVLWGLLNGGDPTLGHRGSVNADAYAYVKAAVRFLSRKMPDAAGVMLDRAVNHPTATFWDIRDAALALENLGSAYTEKAAQMLEAFATRPTATADDIRRAAVRIANLGSDYTERVARMYEAIAKCPTATADDIRDAALALANLGSDYTERAAAMYEASASHPNATACDIRCAAQYLANLGPAYKERAAAMFEAIPNRPNATAEDILAAAQYLANLGPAYKERAAAMFERILNHPTADADEIQIAAQCLANLGSAYTDRATRRLDMSANHANAE